MKMNIKKRLIAVIMLLVMLVCTVPASEVSAKSSAKTTTSVTKTKKAPALKNDSATLYLQGSYATPYSILIDNLSESAKVTYKSSKKSVATVDKSGVITPKKAGKATITVTVKQDKKTYTLKFACKVKAAVIKLTQGTAKRSSEDAPAEMCSDGKLRTGITLAGAEKVSVYSSENKKNYNIRAAVYDATTGKALTKAKDSNNNPYVNISKTGVLTAQGTPGEYYVKFVSYPKGCTTKLYISVSSETLEEKAKRLEAEQTKASEKSDDADEPVKPENTGSGSNSDPGSNPGRAPEDPGKEPENPGKDPEDPAPKTYKISFALAEGSEKLEAQLPEAREYKSGEKIGKLPNAYILNGIFGGWYYDAAKTNAVKPGDIVERDMILYGDLRMAAEQQIIETPHYATVTVPEDKVDGFTFGIKGYTDGCIESFVDSAKNEAVKYTVTSETVTPVLEKGKTYGVVLSEDCTAQFVIDGKEKGVTAKELTIVTERSDVLNLSLSDDIVYLPLAKVSELKGDLFVGLFTATLGENGVQKSEANKYEGSFKYLGNDIKVGSTVAIYEGLRPDKRDYTVFDTKDDGSVAYVTITEQNGNTYGFKTADSQDVLKKVEVLPVPVDADTDGNATNHSVTVARSIFDYSASKYSKLGLDDRTTVDKDDFILFYSGSFEKADFGSYAKVVSVKADGDMFVVEYADADKEEVLASMDMYNKREAKIELTDEEIEEITKSVERQAIESGFLDEAANYLVALSFETDGFKELSDDLDLDLSSYKVCLEDGTELSDDEVMSLMDNGSQAKITKKEAKVYVTPGYRLQMFDGDRSGLRIELVMTLTVTIGEQDEKKDHLELQLQACFEEEILFDIDLDGGAVWEWAGIFPYIDDYEVSASLDWGTAVCAGITATLKTVKGKEAPFDWKNVSGRSAEDSILDIGKQLTKLMNEKEQFMGQTILDENGEEVEATSNAGGLVDKYKAFMEEAQKDEAWFNVVEKEIFDTEGPVDPLGIIMYNVSAKFVVKMNLYITVGATYEAGEGTRYMFYMRIFDRYVRTDTKTIMEPHVNYDFYVFGTLGIKAGIEFEFCVGLFSTKLDSVGITAEVGVYFTIAGYFYAHYTMTVKNGKVEKDSSVSGALSMEIGFYFEVKFKAQLFSNKKLTYNPTLLEKSWPLWTLGEPENVVSFNDLYEDDDPEKPSGDYEDYDDVIEMVWTTNAEFPDEYFEMNVLDLFSGESSEKIIEQDERGKRFSFKFSNEKFKYNPDVNYLYLDIKRGSTDKEETDLTITWNGAPLAFTTKAIERKIKIIWTDPLNARFIAFDSKGGSYVKTIALPSESPLTVPEAPTKTGYDFGGWFTNSGCNEASRFTFPSNMPNYESGGITLYAKWIPRTDTKYVVNHYKQTFNGGYELEENLVYKGTTDSTPLLDDLKKTYDGYHIYTSTISAIRPDGKTVISIYYALNNYKVSFSFGTMKDGSYKTENIVYTVKHGASQLAPELYVAGYEFNGYDGLTTDENESFIVTESAEYTAKWTPAKDTPYTVEHYVRLPGSYDYELYETTFASGETGSTIDFANDKYTDDKFVYVKTYVVNTDSNNPVINANGDSVIRFYYDRAKYKLEYMDGDTAIGSPVDVEWGKSVTKPSDPVKKGYVFDAWYTDRECTAANVFDFEKDVMPAENFKLYAGWKSSDQTEYTVEYYGQDADNAGRYERMDSEIFRGVTDKEVTGVYKDFDHFVKNEDFAARVDKAVIKADGSTVLKLYYDRKTVKINFNANGGTLGTDGASKTFRYGQTFAVSAPERENYGFAGWYIGDEKYVSTTVNAAEEFELTAHWNAGEVNYIAEHYVMGTDGNYPAEATYTDNTLTGIVGDEITLAELKKSDYEVSNGIEFDFAKVEDVTATTADISKNMVVKLYYKRIAYTLTWNLPEGDVPENPDEYTTGTVYYGASVVAPVMKKEGYIYSSDKEAPETMPGSNVTITVSSTPITYTIRFNKNGSDVDGTMNDQSFSYDENKLLTVNAYTRTGYTFEYWTDSADGTTEKYADNAYVKNATAENEAVINLYAKWKPDEYQIEYALDDDSFARPEDKITVYYYGQTLVLPTPVLTGYSFVGWKDESGKSIEMVTTDYVSGKTILKFTPVWEKTEYKIKWDRNGKDENSSDVSALERTRSGNYTTSGYHYTIDPYSGYVFAPDDPTRASSLEWDYTFDGWYTEKINDTEDSKKALSSYVAMYDDAGKDTYPDIVGDVVYYAHWVKSPRLYSIHWYTNGRTASGKITEDTDLIKSSSEASYLNTKNDLGVVYLINENTRLYGEGNRFTGDEEYVFDYYYTPGKAAYGTLITAPLCVKSDPDAPEAAYEFLGWYNVKDCEYDHETVYKLQNADAVPLKVGDKLTEDKFVDRIDNQKGVTDKEVIYVAIWKATPKYYTVSWSSNATDTEVTYTGDSYTCKDGKPVVYGTDIVAPVPVKADSEKYKYEFAGWYTKDNNKIDDLGKVIGDAEFFAHWNPVAK